jgi:hypothetical protein
MAKTKKKAPAVDYDGLYHALFARPRMIAQLLRGFVDASLLDGLDLDRIERKNAKLHARSGRRRDGDMIWRIPGRDGQDTYLVLLLEFQSTNDQYMAVRMLTYAALLWSHVIAEKSLVADGKLPPLLPVVLFNGGAGWRAPEALHDLVALPQASPLWSWQPDFRYHLINVGGFSAAELNTKEGLLPLWFRLENAADGDQLSEAYNALRGWFSSHPGFSEEAEVLVNLVRALFTRRDPDRPVPSNMLETHDMLLERVDQWIEDAKTAGRQEGRKEGRQEGRQEGEARVLLRLLEHRFGVLPAWVIERIHSADTTLIEGWCMRVLDAESLDGVFGDRPA